MYYYYCSKLLFCLLVGDGVTCILLEFTLPAGLLASGNFRHGRVGTYDSPLQRTTVGFNHRERSKNCSTSEGIVHSYALLPINVCVVL